MTTDEVSGTTEDETLLFFPAGEETLFGILTRPSAEPLGIAVIALPGGGGGNTNRNGIGVRLCRRLAGEGFHCFRFDYHGIGESTGVVEQFRVDEPFIEDLEGAVRWIESQGIDKIILFGNCFGARTALSYAPKVAGLKGLALASPAPRDFAMGDRVTTRLAIEWSIWEYIVKGFRIQTFRDLFDPKGRSRVARAVRNKRAAIQAKVGRKLGLHDDDHPRLAPISHLFLDPIEALVERKVPTLFIYGEEDDFYHEFQRARSGRLGRILARAGSVVDIRTLPGEIHGFARTEAQDPVIEVVSQWLGEQRPNVSTSGEESESSWSLAGARSSGASEMRSSGSQGASSHTT